MADRAHGQQRPTMTVNVTGSEKHCFCHGPGMQNKWMESSKALLNFVSSKYGQSTNASSHAGQSVVTEVDESLLRKFKTENEKTDYLDKLEF